MKRKFLLFILTIAFCALCMALFTSCFKHEHNYIQTVTAPTCTEQGFTTYTCECGESYVDYQTPATGHSWKDATGTELQICLVCNAVVIGDSVTSIGVSAFINWSNLTSIVIPNTVTSIGASAFEGCTSLTSVVIPDSVTSIGDSAFKNCYSLTSVIIGDSVTSIGSSVFKNCVSLKYNVKDNLKYLGNAKNPYLYLADTTSTSITSANIDNCCKIIGSSAFSGCSVLTSVVIPDSVTSIGSSVFRGCGSLNEIKLPFVGNTKNGTSNTHFGYIFGASYYDYYDNGYVPSSLKNVTITGGTIGDHAFQNCDSLTSVVIGDSVTSIGYCAFENCNSLTSIVIPDSVTSIGDSAFYGCSGLTSIKYRGTQSQWNAISKDEYWNSNTGSYTITYNYKN